MKRSIGNHIGAALTCVGLLTAGAGAFAQEAPQSQDQYTRQSPNQSTSPSSTETTTPSGGSTSTKHQAMKDCVARERASNSALSESDAKKACRDAMKAQKDNQNSESQPPR
jgi:hypothetical protein